MAQKKNRDDDEAWQAKIAAQEENLKASKAFQHKYKEKHRALTHELAKVQAQLSSSIKKSQMSQDEAIQAWLKTDAYAEHCDDIGVESFLCGLEDAIGRRRELLRPLDCRIFGPE